MYLPITEFRQQIVDTIKANRVVILTSPTGSGKTTQVPQYLLEEGYSSILTQPRRLAARAVAQRMAKETGTKLGELIGLNTRYEKRYSALTRCLVSTDGLVVIRELLGHNTCDVLILDEVHEGGLHTEVLMALAKRALDRYADLKLVIMSATIDAPALSTYFDDAPIIALKGRSYKIRSKRPGASVEADAIDCLKMGKDVLVFQPGLSEIFSTLGKINEVLGDSVYCMPLHAQLSISEQERCFATYDRPKCIVASPIAQTSITIGAMKCVIDSGLENRLEVHGGVPGLHERVISLATAEQRRGRAGRTEDGEYFDHAPPGVKRDAYPVPEIKRVSLDQMVLRLAWQGIDVDDLTFLHQPPAASIKMARDTLNDLGLYTKTRRITKKGVRVAQLPVSVQGGCMLLEAEARNVLDELIPMVAIYDVGGILDRSKSNPSPKWEAICASENESDLIAQLAVYDELKTLSSYDRRSYGIKQKSFDAVLEAHAFLEKRVRELLVSSGDRGDRNDIIASLVAGQKHLVFTQAKSSNKSIGIYRDRHGHARKLSRHSIVKPSKLVIGQPWDIQPKINGNAVELLCMVTKVSQEILSSLKT